MNEYYEEMMKWALGDEYGGSLVKQAPEIWKAKHPDWDGLETLPDKPILPNVCFFTFQMTLSWLSQKEREVKKLSILLKEQLDDKPSLFTMLRE